MDTAAYSDAYVMGWADGDIELVKQCVQTVLRVAKHILTDLTPNPAAGPDTEQPAGASDPTDSERLAVVGT